MSLDLKEIIENTELYFSKKVKIQGWIRSHRKQKTFGFINFYDGTTLSEIQIVYTDKLVNFTNIQELHVGSAISVEGVLAKSQGGNQSFEILANSIICECESNENYPIQPKRHTLEFLREVGHLRPRTKLFQAIFRVRSVAAYAIHKYFKDKGYVYVHTPIITANDGEGAGETFSVSTINFDLAKTPVDYTNDFFGKKTCLAVTGQLEGECYALAYKKIYTFGPTFRAENSNTKTHAAEFWMIEPEIAFCDLNALMAIEEDFLKHIVKYILVHARVEMEHLDKVAPNIGLLKRLETLVDSTAVKITHEEAINILLNANRKWEILPKQGKDLAREHEKYLTDEYYKAPVFVYNWPKGIKAFYMRMNDDEKTVAGVDLLVPGAGELMGGSQREERLNRLVKRMDEMHIPKDDLSWYIDLRKYGGCKHAGFGMGFERLLIYITGVENIRDVIPFPRTPGNCEF
ncbi:MAG: asparagine--tRNA ligase [Christensenellaceae bacterium]|jgi:asparaginyl-tRNA synthetase|nr:asparagine--tRNA ligase [Christensenellaceae bacterium]